MLVVLLLFSLLTLQGFPPESGRLMATSIFGPVWLDRASEAAPRLQHLSPGNQAIGFCEKFFQVRLISIFDSYPHCFATL